MMIPYNSTCFGLFLHFRDVDNRLNWFIGKVQCSLHETRSVRWRSHNSGGSEPVLCHFKTNTDNSSTYTGSVISFKDGIKLHPLLALLLHLALIKRACSDVGTHRWASSPAAVSCSRSHTGPVKPATRWPEHCRWQQPGPCRAGWSPPGAAAPGSPAHCLQTETNSRASKCRTALWLHPWR